jgi:hypothetical protein
VSLPPTAAAAQTAGAVQPSHSSRHTKPSHLHSSHGAAARPGQNNIIINSHTGASLAVAGLSSSSHGWWCSSTLRLPTGTHPSTVAVAHPSKAARAATPTNPWWCGRHLPSCPNSIQRPAAHCRAVDSRRSRRRGCRHCCRLPAVPLPGSCRALRPLRAILPVLTATVGWGPACAHPPVWAVCR